MKTDRLLGIIIELTKHERVTAKELAERFEVSVRTIQRDIEDICKAGIPIVSYRGGNGGIGIMDGFRVDKRVFTIKELENIILGLKSINSIAETSDIERLITKLSPKKDNNISLHNETDIDLSSFYKKSLSSKITKLREAIDRRYVVDIEYFSSKGMMQRSVEPYLINFKWDEWYMLAFCRLRNDFRVFKLKRIGTLSITNEIYNKRNIPEEKKELDNYFNDSNVQQKVTILLHRSLEYIIVDNYGVGSYEIIDEDTIKFSFEYVNYQWMMRFILGFGSKVKVVSPQSVADAVKKEAEKTLDFYK